MGGEIPHLIEKIVNALERSRSVKSTNLYFRGQPMTLKILQQLWLCEHGGAKFGNMCTNFLTDDHWPPRTSFNRMRVLLVTQVVSETVIRLVDTYLVKCGGIKKYALICVLVASIDRLVDIFNNTRVNSRDVVKGREEFNSPQHFH